MSAALIVGSRDDPHVAAVCGRLRRAPIVLDVASIARMRFSYRGDELKLHDDFGIRSLRGAQPARGWLRRIAPQHWQSGVVPESRPFAEMSSWLSLISAMMRDDFALWLTELDASVRADNKLIVQRAARQARVRMPWTIVTNEPQRIPAASDEVVVVKPLGPGHYLDDEGAHNVFATAVQMSALTAVALGSAPFLVQELVPAARHRRVVTVLDRVWGGVLAADGLPLDWRSQPAAHHAFEVDDVPQRVIAGATSVARRLGLGYSSQDWIETPLGEHVLLDVNPAGQWLFLPDGVARPVTQAIADWLSDDD